MVYWASGTTFTKLGIGAANYIMTSSGTAPQWSASIGPAQGGTGITSYAVGDLIYASGTTTLSKLADVATGNALISGGVGVAPSWGKIGLTTHVSGTLGTGNGGTGLTSFTSGGVVYASSTSALTTGSALYFSGTNLGIGEVNPTSKLEVAGTGANNAGARATYEGTIKIDEAGSFSLQTTGGIEFKGSVYGAGYGSKIFSTDSGAMLFGYRQNSADWTETMRLDGGHLWVGSSSNINNGRLEVLAFSSQQAIVAKVQTDANSLFQGFNSSGTVVFQATGGGAVYATGSIQFPSVYSTTSGSAANVFVDSAGSLYRSTSSLKYKKNVEDAIHGLNEVMKLRPVTYKGIGKKDKDTTFGGLIAEEVDAIGLTEFVQYSDDGTPDALAYGNMVSLLIKAIQELNNKFDAYVASHP
jgi:hypothetical protein